MYAHRRGEPRNFHTLVVVGVVAVGAFLASFLMVSAAEITFVTATTSTSFPPGTELHLKVLRGATLPATGTVTVALTSSNGGQFGTANLTRCTDSGTFALTSVTIASGTTQRAFCYRNSTVGNDSITATFTSGSSTVEATFDLVFALPLEPPDDPPPDDTGTTTPPGGGTGTTTPPLDDSGTSTPPGDETGTTTLPEGEGDGGGGEGEDPVATTTTGTTSVTLNITGEGVGTVRTVDGTFICRTTDEACPWSLPVGETVTLLAIPEDGSTFENSWTVGAGTCVGATTPCTVVVTPGLALTAHFDPERPLSTGTRVGARRSGASPVNSVVTTAPRPLVAGETVSLVPVGAPATGAGGGSESPVMPSTVLKLLPLRERWPLRYPF